MTVVVPSIADRPIRSPKRRRHDSRPPVCTHLLTFDCPVSTQRLVKTRGHALTLPSRLTAQPTRLLAKEIEERQFGLFLLGLLDLQRRSSDHAVVFHSRH